MELKKITETVYFIPDTCNIGCIVSGNEAVLIDTGADDRTGKKILKTLNKEGLQVKAVINTHSHADHYGGSGYITEQAGAILYAPEFEDAVIRYPYIEPLYLFSGAKPVEELMTKYFIARPARVDYVIGSDDRQICIGDVPFNIVPLPGHSVNHTGIEVDNVLFCGDAVIAPELIDKHVIPYNVDIEKQRDTLERLAQSNYDLYVPSHCAPVADVSALAAVNAFVLDRIDNGIMECIREPRTTGDIIRDLCDYLNVTLRSIGQYYLVNTTVTAHLSYLTQTEKAEKILKDNQLCWRGV